MMNKRGRFEYNPDYDCWICVSCGHRISNERMDMLNLIPYCPNCDFRNSNPITYKDLYEAVNNDT